MAVVTLFEMATQHGEITAHMGKYLQRQKHTYDFAVVGHGAASYRIYRVYKSSTGDQIMEYRIPERSSSETATMWAYRVRRELDAAWASQIKKPQVSVPTNTTSGMVVFDEASEITREMWQSLTTATSPAPAPKAPESGTGGSTPSSPSHGSSPTSSSMAPPSETSESISPAADPVPGASAPVPPPTPNKSSSTGTTRRSKPRSSSTAS